MSITIRTEGPSTIIDSGLVAKIREKSMACEAAGHLLPEIMELVYAHDWLRTLMPEACGGKEMALTDTVRLFEALAWADANVGWAVNLGAGANMFAGYFDHDAVQGIFADKKVCCAGSGAVSGTAIKVPGGYRLSGKWKYASGAAHATHFTANAHLLDAPGMDVEENNFRSFIVPAQQVKVMPTWDAIGLRATSSHDFEIDSVFVPQNHSFSLLSPSEWSVSPLYRFPFALMAVINMTSMISGIALHFIDLFLALSETKKPLHGKVVLKDEPIVRQVTDHVLPRFYAARSLMYETLEKAWAQCCETGRVEAGLATDLSKAAMEVSKTARSSINELYPLFGLSIVQPSTAANKVWRDAATAGQHYLVSPLYHL